jgi:membrane protein DedA with SNARE-associated domain
MDFERLGPAVKAGVVFALALRIHHHFHGPPVDYLGLAAASFASWVGLPGPGEPVLIAAAVFAARHKLDIAEVILIAAGAAAAGGIVGWLVGLGAGRRVLMAPGPLHGTRLVAVRRGDEIFGKHPVLAILVTPSWVAGIHRVRSSVYLLTNCAGATVWAAGIGISAYYLGPTVIDFVGDLGTVAEILLLVFVGAVLVEVVRRWVRGRRKAAGDLEL